jgi:hypothetical protein
MKIGVNREIAEAASLRDEAMFRFIHENGGKTFLDVLQDTFFKNTDDVQKNRSATMKRIDTLCKRGLIYKKPLGRYANPRFMICLTNEMSDFVFENYNESVKQPKIMSESSLEHEITQQIIYFYFSKIYSCERTHSLMANNFYKIPDILMTTKENGKVYIEIETHKKSPKRYVDIVINIARDNPLQVIYIMKTKKQIEGLVKTFKELTRQNNIKEELEKYFYFIDFETAISNSNSIKKIGATSYKKMLEEPNLFNQNSTTNNATNE